jgi:hypothetical protein
MRKIAAVIVAWNGGEALERCIASLRGQGVFALVIVDNGSRPAGRDRLEKLYGDVPDVRLIALGDNLGFAEGANVGMRAALEDGAEAVLLATQDVVLAPGGLAELRAALDTPGVGLAGPLVLDERTGAELSRGERLVPAWICLPRTLLRYRGGGPEPYEVSGLMGCLLLLDSACLRETGGFDPNFFAYYEEVDLCLRARTAGFRIVCAPRARATHDGMRGFLGGFTPLAARLKARNLVWLMRKHGTLTRWAAFLPTYLLLLLSSAVLYLLRGRADIALALLAGAAAGFGRRPCA